MPTRLLLEGPDIQKLLAQVRDEHGPAAKIVAADRVRHAGLFGFLSRQRYELTVEVRDEAEPVDSLVAAVEAVEDQLRGPGAESARRPSSFQPATPVALTATIAPSTTGPRKAPTGQQTPSPPSPAAPWTPPAPTPAPPTPAPPTPAPAPTPPPAAPTPAAVGRSTGTGGFAHILASLAFPQLTAPALRPANPAVPPGDAPGKAVALASNLAGGLDTAPVPGVRPYRPNPGAELSLRDVLADLGVPERVLREVSGTDSYLAIVRALAAMPPAPRPPTAAGELLVIIGDLGGGLAVARELTDSHDLQPARTLLAASSVAGTGIHPARRLADPHSAARRVARLRKEPVPLIIVVEALADGCDHASARAMVEALDPTAVWAVVDATRKTADTARHLSGLGPIDALAVRSTVATGDPATVLALGLPVALLDARPATPRLWAELLCDRLVQEDP